MLELMLCISQLCDKKRVPSLQPNCKYKHPPADLRVLKIEKFVQPHGISQHMLGLIVNEFSDQGFRKFVTRCGAQGG